MTGKIGKYQIVTELGRGGSGQFLGALDPDTGQEVAIELSMVVAPPAADLRHLRHPNLVSVYEYGLHEGRPYKVMEKLVGKTLQEILARRDPILSRREKVGIILQAAEAFQFAHENGVIHGHFRLGHIMLLVGGSVKVLSFRGADPTRRLIGGAVSYMAPEVFAAAEPVLDARTDTFAFGTACYELLSGRNPWKTGPYTPAGVMYRIMRVEPEPIADLAADCPAELDALVRRMVHKEPGRRLRLADAIPDLRAIASAPG